MKNLTIILMISILCTFLVSEIHAQRPQAEQDALGSRDDGLFSRYPGAVIEYYQLREQKYFLVTDNPFYSEADATYVFPVRQLEGDVMRILYSVPLQNSPEDVFDYYYNALKNSNFEIIFSGKGDNELGPPEEWYYKLYESEQGYNPLEGFDITFQGSNHHFISAQSTMNGGKPVYVSIFIEDDKRRWDFTIIMLDIIEVNS